MWDIGIDSYIWQNICFNSNTLDIIAFMEIIRGRSQITYALGGRA